MNQLTPAAVSREPTAIMLLAKPVWHDRFGARLMRLNSEMSAVAAAQVAVAAYPSAAVLVPEEAAELFVQLTNL